MAERPMTVLGWIAEHPVLTAVLILLLSDGVVNIVRAFRGICHE